MRVLVCGGRDFTNSKAFREAMDRLHSEYRFTRVIHGNARGADTMADSWAFINRIVCRKFPADWKAHGRAAGSIRNQVMLDQAEPHLVVAFPGGAGTADMVRRAERAGVKVIRIEP